MSVATSSCGSRASFDAEWHTIDYTTPNAKESRRPWKLRRLTPTTASPNTSARSPVETEEDSPAHAADMVRIDEPLEWTSPEEWYSEKEKEKQEAILAVMRLESTLKTLNHRAKDLHACMASLLERNKKDHNLKMGMNHTDHHLDLKIKAFNIVSCYRIRRELVRLKCEQASKIARMLEKIKNVPTLDFNKLKESVL